MKTATKRTTAKKKALNYPELAKCIGKFTFLQLAWKDWKKEQPKHGSRIYTVVKFSDGYYPMTGTYLDETFPASTDGVFPKSRWRQVKFDELGLPDIFLEGKDANRFVAWSYIRRIGVLVNSECIVCKSSKCSCVK